MVERGNQLDVARKEHAVAEHVARHVADARDGEIRRLRVDPHLAEVPLDRLPGAARRDAHHLVIVANRPAGGERVAEPEPVLLADRVGVVGEGRGAFVRGHHEVRIVGVVAPDRGRRHDLVAHPVVGEIEQPAQIVLVAGHTFLQEGLAIRGGGRALEHEPALRAHRHDDRILDHLRLHQTEHLGAEILRPVG